MARTSNAATDGGADELGEYTVAQGRSVMTDEGEKGPGETVTLTSTEADRFRALGFILAEDGSRAVPTGGPAVSVEDGVRLKVS